MRFPKSMIFKLQDISFQSLYQRPQPHTTNPWKEEKYKTVGDKKRKSRSCQQESIGSVLETRQSHIIKHWVTKIVPKGHREGHKASAILRSPTTRRPERVPMNNKSTTRTRAGTYGKGNAPLKECIGLLLILNNMHKSARDRRWARWHSKTPSAKKTALLTTLFNSSRCELADEHHTACWEILQTGQDKAPKRSHNAPIMKSLPGLSHDTKPWVSAMETERRCYSKVILASNGTPNINVCLKRYPQYNKVSRLLQHSSI